MVELPAKDTHLHAIFQRLMEQTEVEFQHSKRKEDPDKIPKLSRQDVLDVVRHVWLSVDHNGIASKGYKQTGPLLPLADGGVPLADGGLPPDDLGVYVDLLPFWQRIDGVAVCRDAFAQVDEMWRQGVVSSWSDAATLVEQHAPHRGIDEGLEGIGWDVEHDTAADEAEGVVGPAADDGGMPPDAPPDEQEEEEEGQGGLDPTDDKPVRLYIRTTYVHM